MHVLLLALGCAFGDGGDRDGEAGAASAEEEPPPCNTLTNDGAVIIEREVAEWPPDPEGGEVADGTYALLEDTRFVGDDGGRGPTGATTQGVLVVAGSTFELVYAARDAAELRAVGTIAVAGDELVLAASCPAGWALRRAYSAEEEEILVFDEDLVGVERWIRREGLLE